MEHLNILYEDKDIIVCDKPAGIPVQTRKLRQADMESILKNHLASTSSGSRAPYLAVIHRLDQPVSGLMVFAKNPKSAAELSRQLTGSGFCKDYHAVCCGTLPNSVGTLVDYLVKDGKTNTSRVCSKDTPQAKRAELSYEVIDTQHMENGDTLTTVTVHLKTGRHHQIRVQMAHAGAPLWGDNKYNPQFVQTRGYTPISLRAYHLSFRHPATGKQMNFTLEQPQGTAS